MEEDQLKLLEARIGKAIGFIENLKEREKIHIEEKEDLKRKVSSLEETMGEKDEKIEELKESQVFLKEKIETILNKLESWADVVIESGSEEDVASSGPAAFAENVGDATDEDEEEGTEEEAVEEEGLVEEAESEEFSEESLEEESEDVLEEASEENSEEVNPLFETGEDKDEENFTELDKEGAKEDTSDDDDDDAKSQGSETNPFIED
jgi:hypothetical protein